MLKKILIATLLATGLSVNASDKISYNYLELGYDYLDLSGDHADGIYLNGSFSLNENFYMGGYYDNDDLEGLDVDQYGLFVGFRNAISERSDFYSELNAGRIDVGVADGSVYGVDFGTRTALLTTWCLLVRIPKPISSARFITIFKMAV